MKILSYWLYHVIAWQAAAVPPSSPPPVILHTAVQEAAAPLPPNRPSPVKPPPPPLGTDARFWATPAAPPANPPLPRQRRTVPEQPPGYPFATGGWFGSTPTDDLLPGWWCEWDYAAHRVLYYRLGRDQCFEASLVHPRILGTCEAITFKHHDLYLASFPVYDGIWHGERRRLLLLQEEIHARTDLAAWLYYQAGDELESRRINDFYQFTWQYPLGDDRPPLMRMQELGWSPVPPPITGRGAPPIKAAPRGLDTPANNQQLLANHRLFQQQQQEQTAEAARHEAQRLQDLEDAEEQARESQRKVLELHRQRDLLQQQFEARLRNHHAAEQQAAQQSQQAAQAAALLQQAHQEAARQTQMAEEAQRLSEAEAIREEAAEQSRLAWQKWHSDETQAKATCRGRLPGQSSGSQKGGR